VRDAIGDALAVRERRELVPLTPTEIIRDQQKYITQLEWCAAIFGLAFLLIWMSRR